MKTTLEIPDPVFRRAKSKAAAQGISSRQFLTQAFEDKLRAGPASGPKPWIKHVGKLKDLRKETKRIDTLIEELFEQVDPEEQIWEKRD